MKVSDLMSVIHPYCFEEIIVSRQIDIAKFDKEVFSREDFICVWQQFGDCEIDYLGNDNNKYKTPNLYIQIKD